MNVGVSLSYVNLGFGEAGVKRNASGGQPGASLEPGLSSVFGSLFLADQTFAEGCPCVSNGTSSTVAKLSEETVLGVGLKIVPGNVPLWLDQVTDLILNEHCPGECLPWPRKVCLHGQAVSGECRVGQDLTVVEDNSCGHVLLSCSISHHYVLLV